MWLAQGRQGWWQTPARLNHSLLNQRIFPAQAAHDFPESRDSIEALGGGAKVLLALFFEREFRGLVEQFSTFPNKPESLGERAQAASGPEVRRIDRLFGVKDAVLHFFREVQSNPPVFVVETKGDGEEEPDEAERDSEYGIEKVFPSQRGEVVVERVGKDRERHSQQRPEKSHHGELGEFSKSKSNSGQSGEEGMEHAEDECPEEKQEEEPRRVLLGEEVEDVFHRRESESDHAPVDETIENGVDFPAEQNEEQEKARSLEQFLGDRCNDTGLVDLHEHGSRLGDRLRRDPEYRLRGDREDDRGNGSPEKGSDQQGDRLLFPSVQPPDDERIHDHRDDS